MAATQNGRIPMDLTDPYYGQFWPNGVVAVESAKTWGYNETPYGALGTFSLLTPVRGTVTGNRAEPRIPSSIMARACRNYRAHHGLTQHDVANLLGVTDMSISCIENERYENTLVGTVSRWASVLGLTTEEFLAYADES